MKKGERLEKGGILVEETWETDPQATKEGKLRGKTGTILKRVGEKKEGKKNEGGLAE